MNSRVVALAVALVTLVSSTAGAQIVSGTMGVTGAGMY